MAELPTGTVTFLFTESPRKTAGRSAWETARDDYVQELVPYEGAVFERGRDRGRQLSVDEAVANVLCVN